MNIEDLGFQGATRRFRMAIPVVLIQERKKNWLEKKAKKTSIDGFRPGKVPFSIIEKHFSSDALRHSTQELVNESYSSVLKEYKIKPVFDPEFSVEQNYDLNEGKDYHIVVTFSEIPEIKMSLFSDITLTKLTVPVADNEIQEALKKEAENHTAFKEADHSHLIKRGDKVIFSVQVLLDKKVCDKYTGKDIEIIIDEDQNFKDPLAKIVHNSLQGQSLSQGDVIVPFTFSNNSPDRSMRGKDVIISLRIQRVETPHKIPISEELAIDMGFESLDKFREAIQKKLQRRYESIARVYHKRHLLDALSELHQFDVPQALVEREFRSIWSRFQQELTEHPGALEEEEKTEEELEKEYRNIADRRVRLGVVIGNIARENNISVSEENLKRAIFLEVLRYPDREKDIIQMYQNNPQALEYLRSNLLEDLTVDFLFDKISWNIEMTTPEGLKEKMQDVLPGYGEEENAS